LWHPIIAAKLPTPESLWLLFKGWEKEAGTFVRFFALLEVEKVIIYIYRDENETMILWETQSHKPIIWGSFIEPLFGDLFGWFNQVVYWVYHIGDEEGTMIIITMTMNNMFVGRSIQRNQETSATYL